MLLDEAETSLRASFTSILSPKDREDLVEDARDRLIQWLALVNKKEKPMHKVEPSGVVLHGVCDIQTDRCTAKAGGAITAVWGPPGRTQINVCRACLEEKMRRGEWVVEGARLWQPV